MTLPPGRGPQTRQEQETAAGDVPAGGKAGHRLLKRPPHTRPLMQAQVLPYILLCTNPSLVTPQVQMPPCEDVRNICRAPFQGDGVVAGQGDAAGHWRALHRAHGVPREARSK